MMIMRYAIACLTTLKSHVKPHIMFCYYISHDYHFLGLVFANPLHILFRPIPIFGDITPSNGISKLEKSRQDREALEYMCKLLGGPQGILSLFPLSLCLCNLVAFNELNT
ncbi:hypothetical protein ACH5RR_001141 [Cinchona calisaya]|uniref:Uncharacterized protein n=1 Tax=Cinchona calisaya TaxID=153742 RepID=A0ABD3B2L8_9GENT